MVNELITTGQDKPAEATKQRNRILRNEEKHRKKQAEEGPRQVREVLILKMEAEEAEQSRQDGPKRRKKRQTGLSSGRMQPQKTNNFGLRRRD